MKIIKVTILSFLLVTGLVAKTFAASSDFEGFYIAVEASANGAAVDGTHTDADSKVTKGTAGAVSPIAGAAIGYTYALDDSFFVSLDISYNPLDADFKADGAASDEDVTLTLEDIYTVSLEPSFSVNDNSAVYLTAGYSEFSITAKGTGLKTTQAFDLDGTKIGFGTKTKLDSGLFIKTEIGMKDYDAFTIKDVGSSANGYGKVKADTEMAYGQLSMGFLF